MSKKPWKKPKCECGSCKKCKDRARLDNKKAGTWKVTRRVGSARQEGIDTRKMERREQRELKEAKRKEAAEERQAQPPNSREARARRNKAVGRNVRRYGAKKARWIAWLITQKQKKRYVWSPERKAKVAYLGSIGFVFGEGEKKD